MHMATGLASSMALTGRADHDFRSLEKIQKVSLEEVKNRFQNFLKAPKTRIFLEPAKETQTLTRSEI